MSVRSIYGNVDNIPLDLPERTLKVLQSLHSEVVLPDLDGVAVSSYELEGILAEEADVCAALIGLVAGSLKDLTLSLLHVP